MSDNGIKRYSAHNTAIALQLNYYKDYVDYMNVTNTKLKRKKNEFSPQDIRKWLKKTKKYTEKEISRILRELQCGCCFDCTKPAGFRLSLVYHNGDPNKSKWYKHYQEHHKEMFKIIKYVFLYVIICIVLEY